MRYICHITVYNFGLPLWLSGKESTCNEGDTGDVGSIPGSGRSSGGGNGNTFQYSCLEKCHGQRSLVGHNPQGPKSQSRQNTHTHIGWFYIVYSVMIWCADILQMVTTIRLISTCVVSHIIFAYVCAYVCVCIVRKCWILETCKYLIQYFKLHHHGS